jgi:hypothetical protein
MIQIVPAHFDSNVAYLKLFTLGENEKIFLLQQMVESLVEVLRHELLRSRFRVFSRVAANHRRH